MSNTVVTGLRSKYLSVVFPSRSSRIESVVKLSYFCKSRGLLLTVINYGPVLVFFFFFFFFGHSHGTWNSQARDQTQAKVATQATAGILNPLCWARD